MADTRESRIQTLIETAESLSEEFPESALNSLRKFVEAVVIELVPDSEESGKNQVDSVHQMNNNFSRLKKILPTREYYYLGFIRDMGNYASHFQDDGVDPSEQDIGYCIYAAKEIFHWMYSKSPSNKDIEFIFEIHNAVSCQLCGSKIGEMCKKKSGELVAKNCEHTIRKRGYSAYKRNIQKDYSKTINECFHEMIDAMKIGDEGQISHDDIWKWFQENYPAFSKSSIYTHAMIMATNLKSRLHHKMSSNNDYDLLFAVGNNFRKYRPETDPKPIKDSFE